VTRTRPVCSNLGIRSLTRARDRSRHSTLDGSQRLPDQGWGYSRAPGSANLSSSGRLTTIGSGCERVTAQTVGCSADALISLVHRVRGNEDEVSRARLDDVLQAVAPPVPGGPFKHVQDCLLIAVVVRTGRCAGQHRTEQRAQYLGVTVAAVERRPAGILPPSVGCCRRVRRAERRGSMARPSRNPF
jgi:hypothetical protein